MRAVVFMLASLVLHDSIDMRGGSAARNTDPSVQVLVKAADEPGTDDWEGRFLGLEINLCDSPVQDIDFVSPYKAVTTNFSNPNSNFKSVPTELPSPPPKA